MDASESHDSVIRDRAVRLFTFLKLLSLLKTKVQRDLSVYDEVVWFHKVPQYKGCFSVLSPESDERQDGVWLEIRRPREPQKPPMPNSCSGWLQDNEADDPVVEPRLRDSAPPEIVQEWQHYINDSWLQWCEAYRPWKVANDLYFQLFSIHAQLQKLGERYELLLGLGLLTWETPDNQIIRRHVIVGDAYLTFDANRAMFTLQGAPDGSKLRFETEMIEPDRLPPIRQQKQVEALLDSIKESPWEREKVDNVLRSWVQSVSPDGMYSDSLVPPERCTNKPTVTFAPAIILRQRTERSQVECFAKIAEQIGNGGRIPQGVSLLCEISENIPVLNDAGKEPISGKLADKTLYLPLPANEEQAQIVNQVMSRRGILVQGPPGTGKSHTIANLICHLLAQGKRVLVTSQTPRALRVLKDKIPEEIADLCVILLGNDQAARQELEASVQGISQRYSEWNRAASRAEIERLLSSLFETQKSTANTERLLRELREIDTYHHQVAGGNYTGTAQQIAQRVKKEESRFAWMADDIEANGPCPLSSAEFVELVKLQRELSNEYCSELKLVLVNREDMPDTAQFVKMIDDEKNVRRTLEAYGSRRQSPRFRILMMADVRKRSALTDSASRLIAAVGSVKKRFIWIPQAVSDILSDNDTPWKQMRSFMVDHLKDLRGKAAIAQTVKVEYPDSLDKKKLRSDAHTLLNHLQKGGAMGWGPLAPRVVRDTRYIPKDVRVNGRRCATAEDISLLAAYLDTIEEVEHLWSAWEGRDKKDEGSLLVQVGYLEERLEALEAVLELENYLNAGKVAVGAVKGLAEPQWYKMEEVQEMAIDLEAVECEHVFQRLNSAIQGFIQKVHIAQSSPKAHNLNQEFLDALEQRDAEALARCFDKLEALENGRSLLSQRERLQKRLNKTAPRLARQLQTSFADQAWDTRAQEFEAAWAWSQADCWLAKFNREHNKAKLEAELQQLREAGQKTVAKLAAAKAWESCLGSLTEHQRANLIAWATTMRRIGKGTGKRAPIHRRHAQEFMDECKGAIPAYIMPLYRVFETISPAPEIFDVVIVDEASQTGPEGLVIQYLAKQCVVVGDEHQISPEAVGVLRSSVDALIERHLGNIPFRNLYDPESSLFGHADMRFAGRVVLREHFRCMPEIIQFSNDLCYSSTPLKPLRQYPPQGLKPIVVRHVKNGFREGPAGRAINRPEADALVDTFLEFCSRKEYAGKTMGVISLLGEDQAKYIEGKLLTRMTPTELEERRIVCGDAYAFQGDERDVIFLSMVAAPNETIGALVKETDKRRFNVAASRAKDQLVLFHTATLNDLNPEDMRHLLLKYCLNPVVQEREVDLSRCESQFERGVCEKIADKRYRVIPQYDVAGYRIDLVVEGKKSRLAVECDGDEWHGIEEYEKDVARQRILERCGWRFWRIRGSEYYRDPEGSLGSLWKTLSEMGIRPATEIEPDEEKAAQGQQQKGKIEGLDSEYKSESARELDVRDTATPTEQIIADTRPSPYGTVNEPLLEEPEPKGIAHKASKSDAALDIPELEGRANADMEKSKVRDAKQLSYLPSERDSKAPRVAEANRPSKPELKVDTSFNLADFLTEHRLKFEDMRSKGGALWLIGGRELTHVIVELRKKGVSFTYTEKGGTVSGHRPAWYTQTKL